MSCPWNYHNEALFKNCTRTYHGWLVAARHGMCDAIEYCLIVNATMRYRLSAHCIIHIVINDDALLTIIHWTLSANPTYLLKVNFICIHVGE